MDRRVQALQESAWFKEFPPTAIVELAAAGTVQHLADKQSLYRQGEPSAGITLILSGGIRSGSTSMDGHEFTFSLLKPGAIVGLVSCMDGLGMVNNAIAHGETDVLNIPRDALMHLLKRDPALYGHFVYMLCYRMRKAFSMVDELALVSMRQRLARQICTLVFAEHEQETIAGEIELAITQNDLAVMLGVTRAIVNRLLKEFEDEGLVVPRYRKLLVRDFATLHARCAGQRLFSL
jgi:CRP/FNR family cyclic AMP-dependent transcriptional regulator